MTCIVAVDGLDETQSRRLLQVRSIQARTNELASGPNAQSTDVRQSRVRGAPPAARAARARATDEREIIECSRSWSKRNDHGGDDRADDAAEDADERRLEDTADRRE